MAGAPLEGGGVAGNSPRQEAKEETAAGPPQLESWDQTTGAKEKKGALRGRLNLTAKCSLGWEPGGGRGQ